MDGMSITKLKFEHQKAVAGIDQKGLTLPQLKQKALVAAEPVFGTQSEYWRATGRHMITRTKSKKEMLEALETIFGWAEQDAVKSLTKRNRLADILNQIGRAHV